MIRTIAIENYRSLKSIITTVDQLMVITGANGSGKTNFYRALGLLADVVREGAISTLAAEGGMRLALYAGERSGPQKAMRLGFASDQFSYAIELGQPAAGPFRLDPQIKAEAVWIGEALRPATALADRRGPMVRTRAADGSWETSNWHLGDQDSMMSALADPSRTPELFIIREQARVWRFYDHFRTDMNAPARKPSVATFTPVLSATGGDLAAALATIGRVGLAGALHKAVAEAFDGSQLLLRDDGDGTCQIALRQPGVRRPLGAGELSDGTLRFLMLAGVLLSPRPPGLLVLNEPESSLHSSLMPALAKLIVDGAGRAQIIVVTHSPDLVRCLTSHARLIELEKHNGATTIAGESSYEGPEWIWPER